MGKKSLVDDEIPEEQVTRRRDEVIKCMINTPPQPHKPLKKSKTKISLKLGKRKKSYENR
jgi:hypothetical protein